MSDPAPETRHCPTREDGLQALIAHTIGATTCQERQRKHYHKCFTCLHRNAAVGSRPQATRALPPPPRGVPEELRVERPTPVREAAG